MSQVFYGVLATKSTGILGPIATVLGYLMNGIFTFLESVGIPSVGLSIIIFTIIIYFLMTPLTYKQQKFSKLSAKMNPELQAIRDKYKNKKDNASMSAMQQETSAVYQKYGVSPTGSCLQLLIQMPILFALYRVIYAFPAYVSKIRDAFFPLVDSAVAFDKANSVGKVSDFLRELSTSAQFTKQFANEKFAQDIADYVNYSVDKAANAGNYAANTYIDCLNRISTGSWDNLISKFPQLAQDAVQTKDILHTYNNFLGLNISNSPSFIILDAFGVERFRDIFSNLGNCNFIMVIGALLIPILAALTQWLNVTLMPQIKSTGDSSQDSMMASMKTMNLMMPLMSAVFCFSLPAGMGIYWISGAVVRTVQQVIINKRLDKINLDEILEKNKEKYEKALEKSGVTRGSGKINQVASKNTKYISKNSLTSLDKDKEQALAKSREYFEKNAQPGGIAQKALLVKQFNEKKNSN